MTGNLKSGSALLITVMVVSVLTSMALTGAAVRYEQLASTDKINSATVAKLAAESGVAELRARLASVESNLPYAYDLTRNQALNFTDPSNFHPTPRNSIYSLEQEAAHLPRCLAVAVLSPWVNAGEYLFEEFAKSNPAMIFYFANIINDTRLSDIPGNESLRSDERLVSALTSLGNFYNPFASTWQEPNTPHYWLLKMGGPSDQFLTRKAEDGSSSFYKSLDLVYIPYLPRFTDSGLNKTVGATTQFARLPALELRALFENVIKQNNLKVWLDAAMTDELLYQYGLGDLFVESSEYRLEWLQPSLWNDTKEVESWGPYLTSDIETGSALTWAKQGLPVETAPATGNEWSAVIRRGAKPFAFFTPGTNLTFSPGATINLALYGSIQGVRLNSRVALRLMSAWGPYGQLYGRTDDQGMLYNVAVKAITKTTDSFGDKYTLRLELSSSQLDTPVVTGPGGEPIPGEYAKSDHLAAVALVAPAQFSTSRAPGAVSLSYAGGANDVGLPNGSDRDCPLIAQFNVITVCPGLGDIVQFYHNNNSIVPLWGVVDGINIDCSGGTCNKYAGFSVDKFRRGPLPVRDYAHTSFTDPTDGNKRKVAIYGGRMITNEYDAGFVSESGDLWFYTPSTNAWEYIRPQGDFFEARFGASLTYDSTNQRLALFGGSWHEGQGPNCTDAKQASCLAANRNNQRLAQRFDNKLYFLTLSNRSWSKANVVLPNEPDAKFEYNQLYTVRILSTISERSGAEGLLWNAAIASSHFPLTLDTSGGVETELITMQDSVAGFAKGDEILLIGKTNDQPKRDFRAWGRVTGVANLSGSVKMRWRTYGYSGGDRVTLSSLVIQYLNRSPNGRVCTGLVAFGFGYCDISGDGGVATGDMLSFEKYDASGALVSMLWGYAANANDLISPVTEENRDDDFLGLYSLGNAFKQPAPRWGAGLQFYDPPGVGGNNEPYLLLWQGGQGNWQERFNMPEAWRIGVPAAVGDPISWEMYKLNPTVKITNSTAQEMQVVNYPDNPFVFLPDPGNPDNPEMMPDNQGNWSDSQTWDLRLPPTSGASDHAMISRLAKGAPVTIERQGATAIESFHGIITNISQNSDPYVIQVKHDPAFPGDNGLARDSNFAKIAATYSSIEGREPLSNFNYNEVGGEDRISANGNPDLMQVPRGASVLVYLGTTGKSAVKGLYHGVVAERTHVGSTVTLTFEGGLKAAPLTNPATTVALTRTGPTQVGLLSQSAYQPIIKPGGSDDYSRGALEWLLTDLTTLPANGVTWQARVAAKDSSSQVNDRPAPRQGTAVASMVVDDLGGTPGDKKSVLYLTGGTYGAVSSLWREDKAGHTTGAGWQLKEAPVNRAEELPNVFGGALEVYEGNKAVFFGGKQRTDSFRSDRRTHFGARLLGVPQGADPGSDTVFTLADQASLLDGRRAINGIYDFLAPNSTGRDSFRLTENDLGNDTCTYVGQLDSPEGGSCKGHHIRHLGSLGRFSSTYSAFAGATAGYTGVIQNPGSAFKADGGSSSIILSGPSRSYNATTKRSGQDGYYPYTEAASDKTLMISGIARLKDANGKGQGTILVTAMGIGKGIVYQPGKEALNGRASSYCAIYEADGSCKVGPEGRYLSWLPEGEDVVALLSIAQTLGETDTYRIIGYYGGVTWALLVNVRGGVFSISQTIP